MFIVKGLDADAFVRGGSLHCLALPDVDRLLNVELNAGT
jgi:hypothetical protein